MLATLHLDLVKERNKLKEPPKPLPNAPFFLPTAHEGVTPRFAAPLGDEENEAPEPETTGRRPSLFEELTEEKDKMASYPSWVCRDDRYISHIYIYTILL